MNKKKTMSGISKKGKRRENRDKCALYAEHIYEELTNYFSSTKMEVTFLKTPIERLSIGEDPKWLTLEVDGIFYEIKMCAYKGHMETLPFDYSYHEYYGNRMRYRWYFSVCYNLSSPQDVREMVILAHSLYTSYHREETINEMKDLAIKYDLGFVGVYQDDADNEELTRLFISDHHVENDKYGLTYFYIDYHYCPVKVG